MVTGFATLAHLGHVGVKFMVKVDRLVKVGNFIDYERIWSFTDIMFGVRHRHQNCRTRLQAHILCGWFVAQVTLQTVESVSKDNLVA
jgi:hypothetical protein